MDQKFEHSALEQDIERLSLEMRGEHAVEIPRDTVRERIAHEGAKPAPVVDAPAPTGGGQSLLPTYLQNAPDDIKLHVEQALDMAIHKGIAAGAKEAQKHGPYVLDGYHDALTDHLRAELKKQ